MKGTRTCFNLSCRRYSAYQEGGAIHVAKADLFETVSVQFLHQCEVSPAISRLGTLRRSIFGSHPMLARPYRARVLRVTPRLRNHSKQATEYIEQPYLDGVLCLASEDRENVESQRNFRPIRGVLLCVVNVSSSTALRLRDSSGCLLLHRL